MPPMPCRGAEKSMPESRPPMSGKITGADCDSHSRTREAVLTQKIWPASGTRSLPQKGPRATALVFHWSGTLCRNTMACCASAAAPRQATAGPCLVFSCLALERLLLGNELNYKDLRHTSTDAGFTTRNTRAPMRIFIQQSGDTIFCPSNFNEEVREKLLEMGAKQMVQTLTIRA